MVKKKIAALTMAVMVTALNFTSVNAGTIQNNVDSFKDSIKSDSVFAKVSSDAQRKALEKLQGISGNNLDFYENNKDGNSFTISGKLTGQVAATADSAVKFLKENKAALGLTGSKDDFKAKETTKDDLGYTNVRASQLINGLEVVGRQAIVHIDKNGVVSSVNGNVDTSITSVAKLGSKTVTASEAVEIAKKQYTITELREAAKAEKKIYIKDGQAYEAYEVHISIFKPSIVNDLVYVEASSGTILDKLSLIREETKTTGKGKSGDGSTKTLNITKYSSGTYILHDLTRGNSSNGGIETGNFSDYDYNGFPEGSYVSNGTTNFTSPSSTDRHSNLIPAVDAHYNAGVVYDFYKNIFKRNSIDGKGMALVSYVHAADTQTGSLNYDNAFWDGYEMVYGDGDNEYFSYLSTGLDVVGHEMTHGVTSHTAGLIYKNESGALDEAMSDIFGVLIESYSKDKVKSGGKWTFKDSDWKIGDAVFTPSVAGDSLRNLADPHNSNKLDDPYPADMSEYLDTTSDGGGVHTNSTIIGHAAYFVAKSIGYEKTAKIYYRALTTYMTPTSGFLDSRNYLIKAATDLYGASSTAVKAVKNAYDKVGIIQDPYEPNKYIDYAYRLTSGKAVKSYISASNDKDYYKVVAGKDGKLDAKLSTLPKDYDLYIYNVDGKYIADSSNSGTSSEEIALNVSAGTYYIGVKAKSGQTDFAKQYTLSCTFPESGLPKDTYEKNDSIAQAYKISLGKSYKSYISYSGDSDCYKITLTKAGTLNTNISNLSTGSYIAAIFSAGGEAIDVTDESSSMKMSTKLPAGTYYLLIEGNDSSDYSSSNAYTVSVTE